MAYVLVCALAPHRTLSHGLRRGDLRHDPSQVLEGRRPGSCRCPPHQGRYGVGLSDRGGVGDRRRSARSLFLRSARLTARRRGVDHAASPFGTLGTPKIYNLPPRIGATGRHARRSIEFRPGLSSTLSISRRHTQAQTPRDSRCGTEFPRCLGVAET
jgi:hypothetical protein